MNLRKDLAEMQEWMTQVDEEFLMRDFEYKSPEDLQASLEEMKVSVEAWTYIKCTNSDSLCSICASVCLLLAFISCRELKRTCYRRR